MDAKWMEAMDPNTTAERRDALLIEMSNISEEEPIDVLNALAYMEFLIDTHGTVTNTGRKGMLNMIQTLKSNSYVHTDAESLDNVWEEVILPTTTEERRKYLFYELFNVLESGRPISPKCALQYIQYMAEPSFAIGEDAKLKGVLNMSHRLLYDVMQVKRIPPPRGRRPKGGEWDSLNGVWLFK